MHVVVGVDPEGRMYLLDLWRKQAASDEWIEAFCSLVRQWRPREWAEEKGQIKASVGPFLERMQRERQAFVYRRDFPVRGDKAVRAQSIRGRMAVEGLYIPQDAPWAADLRSELLAFPAGRPGRRAGTHRPVARHHYRGEQAQHRRQAETGHRLPAARPT